MANILTPDLQQMLRTDSAGSLRTAADQSNPLATPLTYWRISTRVAGSHGLLKDSEFSERIVAKKKPNPPLRGFVQKYPQGFSAWAVIEEITRADSRKKVGIDLYRALRCGHVLTSLTTANKLMFARTAHNAFESAAGNLRREISDRAGLYGRILKTIQGFDQKIPASSTNLILQRADSCR